MSVRYLFLATPDRCDLADGLRKIGHHVVAGCHADGVVEIVRSIDRPFDAVVVDAGRPPFDAAAGAALDFLTVARRCDRAGGLISDTTTAVVALCPLALVDVVRRCGADVAVPSPATVGEVAAAVEQAVRRRCGEDDDSLDLAPEEARDLIARVNEAIEKIRAYA